MTSSANAAVLPWLAGLDELGMATYLHCGWAMLLYGSRATEPRAGCRLPSADQQTLQNEVFVKRYECSCYDLPAECPYGSTRQYLEIVSPSAVTRGIEGRAGCKLWKQ